MQITEALREAVENDASALVVEGGAGSGKTQAVVERVALLLERGVAADQIAVFAATRTAAGELRQRLGALTPQAADVLVATPYEYAVQMLSSEEALRSTGRVPRVLEDFEERILVEDLKVLGIKPRRLREMLKFFYRTYSELGDEQEGFLLSTEEHMLSDALGAHLAARGAMLVHELTNVGVKFLRSPDGHAYKARYTHVLADDYQDMSRATHLMLALLAGQQLFVCGNTNATVQTTEAYPCPEGVASFTLNHPGAARVCLSDNLRSGPQIVAVGGALAAQPGMDPACVCGAAAAEDARVRLVQWTLPNAEFVHVSDYVASRVKGSVDPIHPRDVYIAVPNALWGRAFSKVLADAGVKTSLMLGYHALSGDPRDMDKCADLRLFTVLNLAADPTDVAAWRNWCGFGDYLTHSNHWCRLEEYAADAGMGALQALDAVSAAEKELFLGAGVLAQRYHAGQQMLQAAKGKSGFSLLSVLFEGKDIPAGMAELLDPVTGTESAQELFARACAHTEIQFSGEDAVRIGLPQMAVGQHFDTVVVAGFVDGFYPPSDVFGVELEDDRKQQILLEQRRALYLVTQAARNTLVLSCFMRDEAASATKLGMYVRRIRDIDGKRMGILSPSSFIDELGDAAPGMDTTL